MEFCGLVSRMELAASECCMLSSRRVPRFDGPDSFISEQRILIFYGEAFSNHNGLSAISLYELVDEVMLRGIDALNSTNPCTTLPLRSHLIFYRAAYWLNGLRDSNSGSTWSAVRAG
jgi:hypothetical protein